jgi:hypothetical protein
VEVAGYYGHLARGLRDLGVEATFVQLSEHPFRYGRERATRLERGIQAAWRRRSAAPRTARLRRGAWMGVEGLLRLALAGWAVARFDAFVFGFGMTFLGRPSLELPLLRLLGKRVVAVFHGSDSRPPYLDGSVMAADRGRTPADCVRLAGETKRRVAAFDRHAVHVVESPLAAHFHERPCVSWLAIGIPHEAAAGSAPESVAATHGEPAGVGRGGERAPVRILHSPSHPEAKGSDRIAAAIEALRARGHAIDFVQITGRAHAEVQRELARCDLVVDQLYSDTPMAGFATEAAHHGKPAVVGGYGAEMLRRMVPPELMPPTEYCHPDDVEQAIERLVADADYRLSLGARARAFVQSEWSVPCVAERYLRLLTGDVPATWRFDPGDASFRYVHGCALPEHRARGLVADVVRLGGRAALQVGDKPELERALLAFAQPVVAEPEPACSRDS